MNWFRSSPTATTAQTPQNAGAELKPKGDAAAAVKPCCVCKDEKSARDECMLFSRSDNPQEECQSMVEKYKVCMRGFGFETH
ncbi:ATP-dependent RNA helicase ROK1 [Venturia nashicola]|uniref:ATP-dependent RNA helicase ROK1 n=1 Tax=Venturia nashicola TaxID=86259 RepID=A0A4Z1NTY7_9PEZI|nr:ATP-dependent RNA helicase ROK1 [Venturia nashicola]TLD25737.1 ATP-dependent RNA helicase ROK1 [Venturia nashicola]